MYRDAITFGVVTARGPANAYDGASAWTLFYCVWRSHDYDV